MPICWKELYEHVLKLTLLVLHHKVDPDPSSPSCHTEEEHMKQSQVLEYLKSIFLSPQRQASLDFLAKSRTALCGRARGLDW
jgi:hypothetical protein